jgi:hypothetical protein
LVSRAQARATYRGRPWLEVSFEAVLRAPRAQAAAIDAFLGLGLDVAAMAAQVHQRGGACTPDLTTEHEACRE